MKHYVVQRQLASCLPVAHVNTILLYGSQHWACAVATYLRIYEKAPGQDLSLWLWVRQLLSVTAMHEADKLQIPCCKQHASQCS